MLYFIHGDPNMVFKKASDMAESLLKKKPDASITKIDGEKFDENKLDEVLNTQGLFVNKYIVILSRILDDKDKGDILLKRIKELGESENVFIWAEEVINKKDLNKIEKHSAKVQEYQIKEKKDERVDVFKITNLLGDRRKKELWLEYVFLINKGIPVEEIYGILWWQVKSMLLASKTNSADEAGMKSFPYNKAKGYCRKYNEEELDSLAFNLIKVYHQSRVDSQDLSDNMEALLLKL